MIEIVKDYLPPTFILIFDYSVCYTSGKGAYHYGVFSSSAKLARKFTKKAVLFSFQNPPRKRTYQLQCAYMKMEPGKIVAEGDFKDICNRPYGVNPTVFDQYKQETLRKIEELALPEQHVFRKSVYLAEMEAPPLSQYVALGSGTLPIPRDTHYTIFLQNPMYLKLSRKLIRVVKIPLNKLIYAEDSRYTFYQVIYGDVLDGR
jgi:hypothetical protein